MQRGSRFRQAVLQGAVPGGTQRFLQTCRSLAGWGSQYNTEFLAAALAYHALENLEDSSGFAGARPSGDYDKMSSERGLDRESLKVTPSWLKWCLVVGV